MQNAGIKFEVGKQYEWNDPGYGFLRVASRSEKTVTMTNDSNVTWRMLLRYDEDGNEMVIDSSVPKNRRGAFTCNAKWEVE